MPRRTISPADEGIRAAREEHIAAREQTDQTTDTLADQTHDEQTAQAPNEQDSTPGAIPPMKADVRITSTRNVYDDPTRATATVTLNDAFVIKGFRVVKGDNGLFCSMPARRLRDGSYSEVCHAITPDFARQLNASVLSEYQVHLAQQMEESQQTPHVIEPEQNIPEFEVPEQGPEMEM